MLMITVTSDAYPAGDYHTSALAKFMATNRGSFRKRPSMFLHKRCSASETLARGGLLHFRQSSQNRHTNLQFHHLLGPTAAASDIVSRLQWANFALLQLPVCGAQRFLCMISASGLHVNSTAIPDVRCTRDSGTFS